MKLIILVDGNPYNYEKLKEVANEDKTIFLDTGIVGENIEYDILEKKIKEFSNSNKEIMLVKYSGREDVYENLGDELPDMMVSLSYNKKSKYYLENPVNMFLDLMSVFKTKKVQKV